MTQTNIPENFYGLGIAPKILSILDKLKFVKPTPIQAKTIPTALEGSDVIGIAQTGTGKTLAFGIPMMQRFAQINGRGLVLVPTRELAVQVEESIRKIGQPLGIRSVVLIGGAAMDRQIDGLRRNPRVVIATPGRLIDHVKQKNLNLNNIEILVLDEADRMLDMGFAPDIKWIISHVPKQRQVMLFSATMPQEILSLSMSYMKLPVHVEIAPTGTTAADVTQELFIVRKEAKRELLNKLLTEHHGSILVFARTKHAAHRIARDMKTRGHRATDIHSDRTLAQRREALEGFRSGKYRVLIATDIASRGLDVKGIELVVNFDLPDEIENYVHRIGRTGRAGYKGQAITLATPEEGREIKKIETFIKQELKVSTHPEFPTEKFLFNASAPAQRVGHWANTRRRMHRRR